MRGGAIRRGRLGSFVMETACAARLLQGAPQAPPLKSHKAQLLDPTLPTGCPYPTIPDGPSPFRAPPHPAHPDSSHSSPSMPWVRKDPDTSMQGAGFRPHSNRPALGPSTLRI